MEKLINPASKINILAYLILKFLLVFFLLEGPHVLAGETCVREADGNIACGKIIPDRGEKTSEGKNTKPIFIDSEYGLTFEFRACYESGSDLDCLVDVHNETNIEHTIVFPNRGVGLRDKNGSYSKSYQSSIAEGGWSGTLRPNSTTEVLFRFRPDLPLSHQVQTFTVRYNINFRDPKSFDWRNFSIKNGQT